ncbi:MAG: TetR/AcrR family transcriptional regulator [Actinomycetota bacterium]|jgi:AcrR family transcriptional regulator
MKEQSKFDLKRFGALSATLRVIARDGLEKTTIRAIAKEAGCSAGSLAHYFSDKEDILRQALELADEQISKRISDIISKTEPNLALREVLAQVLPIDNDRTVELALDVNFWGRALIHPELRGLEHEDHDRWRNIVLELISSIASSRKSEISAKNLTDVLIAFLDGLGLQALIYPELFPPDRQLELLDLQLIQLGLNTQVLNS